MIKQILVVLALMTSSLAFSGECKPLILEHTSLPGLDVTRVPNPQWFILSWLSDGYPTQIIITPFKEEPIIPNEGVEIISKQPCQNLGVKFMFYVLQRTKRISPI